MSDAREIPSQSKPRRSALYQTNSQYALDGRASDQSYSRCGVRVRAAGGIDVDVLAWDSQIEGIRRKLSSAHSWCRPRSAGAEFSQSKSVGSQLVGPCCVT
jgi:hypothetical protein